MTLATLGRLALLLGISLGAPACSTAVKGTLGEVCRQQCGKNYWDASQLRECYARCDGPR